MKRLLLLVSVLTILLAGFTVQPATAQSSAWTAEYFNNTALAGPPVLVRTETSPTNEWGFGSPGPGVLADNFSARWTTTTFLNAGNYLISVRADDGVRVYVDGVLYINEWHLATGRLYQATVPLGAGNHTFVVEFFEASEVASLIYNFTLQAPVPPPGTPQARVTAQFLNVRSLPNASSAILTVISQGQIFPVVGRNFNSSWLQLNVNGTLGWVNARYVAASNITGVPITDASTPVPPPPIGATATVTAYVLNVRNAPNPFTGVVLTQITRGQVYPVIGRNLDTSWVQVNINGLIGWVRSTWVALTNIASVPVTSNTTNPSQPAPVNTFATVRAYFLNVRSQPFFGAPVLAIISRGQTYPVIGRNANNTWIQVNIGGMLGWVRSTWVIVVPNLANVPVTG
ncbi:MAG TPA: SH3 domain-containing protein [Spirillospora sp.]|nr:SH3 domain-containing protein [Spirillospora sp.]